MWKAIAAPGEPLGMDIPVFPSRREARFGMIDDPVFGLAKRLYKRAMPDTPNLIGLLEDRPMFFPGFRIENVLRLVVQQPKAIVGGPTSARRINHEQIAVAFQHLRS